MNICIPHKIKLICSTISPLLSMIKSNSQAQTGGWACSAVMMTITSFTWDSNLLQVTTSQVTRFKCGSRLVTQALIGKASHFQLYQLILLQVIRKFCQKLVQQIQISQVLLVVLVQASLQITFKKIVGSSVWLITHVTLQEQQLVLYNPMCWS